MERKEGKEGKVERKEEREEENIYSRIAKRTISQKFLLPFKKCFGLFACLFVLLRQCLVE